MRIVAKKWLSMSLENRIKTLQIVSRAQRLEVILYVHDIDPAPLRDARKLLEEVLTA